MGELTPPDVGQIIDIETQHPGGHTGLKEQRMRDDLGLSPTRYYQRLGRILDTAELLQAALEHNPTTTNRLLHNREQRAARVR